MLKRVISGIIGLILLIVLLLTPNVYIFDVALFLVMLIGLNEFFNAMKVEAISIKLVGFFIMIPQLIFFNSPNIGNFSMFILILAVFSLVIISNKVENIHYVYISLLGIMLLGFMSSHILRVREMHFGNLLIWLVFIGAWATDTFAYFVGRILGKHELTPISPKKTIEGSIGGLLGTTFVMFLYGLFISRQYGVPYSLFNYIIIGLMCGLVSQIGDLAASMLKRSANIKDFGNIMPGHGGILDRFDSILFVAPAVFYYLHFFMRLV